MNDRPGFGIGIVDRDLGIGQTMLEDLVFDSREGQGAREVEALSLEIPGDELHRRDTACPDFGRERLMCRESGFGSPQAEAGRISEVGNVRSAGSRGV